MLTNELGSPLIGGAASSPANTFPNLFSHDFFRTYPYFLPGCIASVISLTGAIFGYLVLEEVSFSHSFPTSVFTCHRRLCLANVEDLPRRSPRIIRNKNRNHTLSGCLYPCLISVPLACLEPASVSRIQPSTYFLSFSASLPSNLVVSHSLYVTLYFARYPLTYT